MSKFSYRFDKHRQMGFQVVRLSCAGSDPDPSAEKSVAQFTPEIGSNLFNFKVDGIDYLLDINKDTDPPKLLGTPILYPTPNRVRDAQFTFAGRSFKFKPNNNANFIHGLVRDQLWTYDKPVAAGDSVSISTSITFEPGKDIYDLFPIRNTLKLTYILKADAIRFDFSIHNDDNQSPLPFGLAIHPYFCIIGPRESVRLQVPAQKWMEAIDLLPTGRLIDLENAPADLRKPVRLSQLNLDDVYWGIEPNNPQVIYYDSIGKKVTLTASDFFTHSVIYTPQRSAFFCIENQSCSTDAHNLYAQGLKKEAHLSILAPGETLSAWIEIKVSDQ